MVVWTRKFILRDRRSSIMGQSLATRAVTGMAHPLLVPLGFTRSGRPILPIMGAAPGDDEDDDNDEGTSEDGTTGSAGGSEDDDEGAGDDEDASDDDAAPKSRRVKELSDENARRRNENKSLRSELEESKRKLKEIEDSELGELEKTKKTLEETQAARDKLVGQNRQLLLENAFLSNNTYVWKNPRTALKLVDLSEVDVDDENAVTGLNEALKKLAEAEPYLLKKSGEDDEDAGSTTNFGQARGRKSKNEVNRDALMSKYPALRR